MCCVLLCFIVRRWLTFDALQRVRYDEKLDDGANAKASANTDAMEVDEKPAPAVERAESPEEGEI